MAEHTAEKITINGCSIEMLRGGTGETLLFLHGAGGIKEWPPYLDALAEKFDVLAPSHPGFGVTPGLSWMSRPSDMHYFTCGCCRRWDSIASSTRSRQSFACWPTVAWGRTRR